MLITMSADGSLITSIPSVINQGSNNANQLVVVSPIAESNSLTITFKLPNGNYTEPALMTPAENIDTQLGFNAWTYLLNYNTNTKSTTKDLSKVSSTTGNIYGVYDMSGGAYEYTMGNMVSPRRMYITTAAIPKRFPIRAAMNNITGI